MLSAAFRGRRRDLSRHSLNTRLFLSTRLTVVKKKELGYSTHASDIEGNSVSGCNGVCALRIEKLYSHLNGHEWLLVHQRKIWEEIEKIVSKVDANKFKTKVSKEKTMRGKLLFAPKELNKRLTAEFRKADWCESRTSYWVTDDYNLIRKTLHLAADKQKKEIEAAGHRAISSYNQTDFVKNRVAVEIQFGKYSFIAYDLFVKHLAFYVRDAIDVGIEVLPMKSMQQEMSSGPGYYESALYDIARQGRGVPAVPLVLVGILP